MKLYSEHEIKRLMKSKAIYLQGEDLILNDDLVDKDILIRSLKEIQMKNMSEKESFNQYKNGNGQKNKNKIRKG